MEQRERGRVMDAAGGAVGSGLPSLHKQVGFPYVTLSMVLGVVGVPSRL